MYDYKYKKEYKYKQLKRTDIKELQGIIESIDGLNVKVIKTYRKMKINKVVEEQKKEFNKFEDLLMYLDDSVNYLENFSIEMITDEEERVDLEFDKYFYNWELTYNKQTKTIDSLILNLSNVFKFNLIDFFKKKHWIMFWMLYVIQLFLTFYLKDKSIFTTIYSFLVLFLCILNLFIKCRPYSNNKFINRNKDNIFFYFLGVITPYVIDFIINLFNK